MLVENLSMQAMMQQNIQNYSSAMSKTWGVGIRIRNSNHEHFNI